MAIATSVPPIVASSTARMSIRLPDMRMPGRREQYFEIVGIGLAVDADDPLQDGAAEDREHAHAPAESEQGKDDEHQGHVKVVLGCLTFTTEQELRPLQTGVNSIGPWP
jgi:hypothetical protein